MGVQHEHRRQDELGNKVMKSKLGIPIQSLAFEIAVMAERYERRELHPVVIAAAEKVGWSMLNLYDVEIKARFGREYRIAVKEYQEAQQRHLEDIRAIIGSET